MHCALRSHHLSWSVHRFAKVTENTLLHHKWYLQAVLLLHRNLKGFKQIYQNRNGNISVWKHQDF